MMCLQCQAAGDVVTESDYYDLSAYLHQGCEYPASCTCQHSVGGEWINRGNARS